MKNPTTFTVKINYENISEILTAQNATFDRKNGLSKRVFLNISTNETDVQGSVVEFLGFTKDNEYAIIRSYEK